MELLLEAFSNVVVRREGGGQVFYSPMIRYQSFSEPVPLYCELHRVSFFLPPWVGLDG